MSHPFNYSSLRFAAIMVAAVFLGQRATAQPNNSTDPFVIMRGGAGDQMMPYSKTYDYDIRGGKSPNFMDLTPEEQNRLLGLIQVLYVPQVPPALGEGLPGTWGAGLGSSLVPNYDRETFYGGYAILVLQSKLSTKETERIAAYGNVRGQLLKEILAKFEALAGATPAERRAGLAELAAQQDTRLRALAGEEEAIRDELAWVNSVQEFRIALQGGVFRFDQSTPEPRRLFSGAYFYAGLSTEQRLLLTEIAYGQAVGTKLDGQEGKVADTAGFFFLPATASLRLPTSMPPALEEKIRAFAREKESLKSELRSAVLREDYFFASTRTKRLAALAGQQAPRFAALDALAEEIRVGFADLGAFNPPEDSALPADLTQRLGSFNARKVEVRRELVNRLRQLRSGHPAERFDIARQGDGLAIVQTGPHPIPAAGLAEFNDSQARQYTAFADESKILRRDIEAYLENFPQRGTRTVDQLAADFGKAYVARENRGRYRDYARAVLEPGLSAAQRRLLFQSALAELEQNGGPLQP